MKRLFPLIAFLIIPISMSAHEIADSDQALLAEGGLWAYIWVGAVHMLTGYDHLLFLTGVIFFLTDFKSIVKFITAFTIGHSITLLTATYLGFKVDEHLIDAIIALSVLYKGFENLGGFEKLLKTSSPNLLNMVFIFGLIHGLGLSSRLQSFDIGDSLFLAKIVSFNVGVELGQVLALVPIIFIISRWKTVKSYTSFYKAVNLYLIIAGIVLFILQMRSYFTHL